VREADREWIRQSVAAAYQAVVVAIREHPDPAVLAYCLRNWEWTERVITASIASVVERRLAERDAEAIKAEGRLN
jgi:hypothetical protein